MQADKKPISYAGPLGPLLVASRFAMTGSWRVRRRSCRPRHREESVQATRERRVYGRWLKRWCSPGELLPPEELTHHPGVLTAELPTTATCHPALRSVGVARKPSARGANLLCAETSARPVETRNWETYHGTLPAFAFQLGLGSAKAPNDPEKRGHAAGPGAYPPLAGPWVAGSTPLASCHAEITSFCRCGGQERVAN